MVERNIDFVLKWADALESGKYKQGKELLRRGDEFCCHGVACELLGYKKRHSDGHNCYEYEHPDGYYAAAMPTFSMLNDFGLTGSEAHELAEMNDYGVDFVSIAAKLREWASRWSNPNG